jgi:hypothetical protein
MDRLFLCLCLTSVIACGGAADSPSPVTQDVLESDAPLDADSEILTPDPDPDVAAGDGDGSSGSDTQDGGDGQSAGDTTSEGPLDASQTDALDGQETQDVTADYLGDALEDATAQDVENGPDAEEVSDASVVEDAAAQDTPATTDGAPDGVEDVGNIDVVEEVVDEVVEDTAPVDPCLGSNCDDGDPCTENSCVEGSCVFAIVPGDEGVSCGQNHACSQGQCVPACADLQGETQDLMESPGGLVSENCAWVQGAGWTCSGAGDAGNLTSPALLGLSMFRLDVTADMEDSGTLALTWPVGGASEWRTVHLTTTALSITTGPQPLSTQTVSSGPFSLALSAGVHTLTLLRLADQSFRALVDGATVVKTGVLPSAPNVLDLILAPSFLSVTLLELSRSSVVSSCEDQNPCTSDQCDWESGACQEENLDGAPCPDDGLACTVELCVGGVCEHGTEELACLVDGICYASGDPNPQNPCAVCAPETGQSAFSPAAPSPPVSCDDEDPCTQGDLCQGMTCVGAPMNCDDLSSCTLDLCAGGVCEHLAGEDGLLCSDSSLCALGACVPACLGPPELETGFDQGSGLWSELAGSWSAAQGALVQSGGGAGGVSHPALIDVQSFDLVYLMSITEDDPVTGTQGVARVDLYEGELSPDELPRYRVQVQTNHPIFGGSITLSFAGPGFLIQVDQALIDLEVDQQILLGVRLTPDGRLEASIDGDLMVDLTDFGGLPESVAVALGFDQHGAIDDVVFISSGQFCDDGLVCTEDLCLADGSCESTLVSQACLLDGVCYEAGELSPDNPCAVCEPSLSAVQWSPSGDSESPVSCALDDPCEENGACALDALACVGEPLDCDDEDPCTVDACVEGDCQSIAILCDDEDLCTVDACVQGACVFEPLACDDEDLCTVDACVEGDCQSTAIVCDDEEPCTVDACVQEACVFEPLDCDDSDACTSDLCVDGACTFEPIDGCD